MASAHSYVVRPLLTGDRDPWRRLYAGYLDFYETALTEDELATVWSWLLDEKHPVSGLVVEGPDGVIGLAHYREFFRPSSASVGGYLDDLFVSPPARGTGAVDALLRELKALATERGWTVIRWITADDNYRARSKYDQHASRTPWITYDLDLHATSDHGR